MSKKYHILVGKFETTSAPFEMIFGDYVKSVVTDEKDDVKDGGEYVSLRVITLTEDNESAIISAVRNLNS